MVNTQDVSDAIAAALQDQAEIETAKQELEAAQDNARARLKAVRELIADGQSTGDSIRDFVILKYGDLHAEYDDIFRDLSNRVAAHPGELILVVTSKESSFGCTGFGGERQVTWSCDFQLGILEPNAKGINIELRHNDVTDSQTRWSLPTTRCVVYSDRAFGSGEVKEVIGAITPGWRVDVTTCLLPSPINDYIDPEGSARRSNRWNLRHKKHFIDILIGDEEVLGAKGEYRNLAGMLKKLGVDSSERTLF